MLGFFVKQNNYTIGKIYQDTNSKRIQFLNKDDMQKIITNSKKNLITINFLSKSFDAKIASINEDEHTIKIYDDNLPSDSNEQNVHVLISSESIIWTIIGI